MNAQLLLILNLCSITLGWYSCPFNDGTFLKPLSENLTIKAECMYLTSPLEWNQFNPNTFDGEYYNSTRQIPLTDLHMKRLLLSSFSSIQNNSSRKHIINYWLINGGGGSQYGMETFGISMLEEIVLNNYDKIYSNTHPIMYLFQYRGAGLSKPSIHCYRATTWTDCAQELIETTIPSSRNESFMIIHAMTNANIAQDLQYQIQYSINQSESICRTSTYIYGLSQGSGIIETYLTIQSINSHMQIIDGIILDGVMSIKHSDVFRNQLKNLNHRFYLYLSKCQQDSLCSKAFHQVTGTNQDIIGVTLTLEMLFETNMTNVQCTTQLGLNDWNLFMLIANQAIEVINYRPLAAILIARIYRCSNEDQQILSRSLPFMVNIAQQSISKRFIDPPYLYPNDGNVLSLTIWSDFIGFNLNENIKENFTFFNDFCINSRVLNEFNLARTGPIQFCDETQIFKYNYTLSSPLRDVLYTRNSNYWGKFKVNQEIFRSKRSGVLLFNGDLDYNSPMSAAQQVQRLFQSESIRTKLIEMKGLTHVTAIQSYTKKGGFQSSTCTHQIIREFLYQEELNLDLDTINYTCSSQDNLIGIDWFYSDPMVNQTLYTVFANSITNYWGVNITDIDMELITNKSKKLNMNLFLIDFYIVLSFLIFCRGLPSNNTFQVKSTCDPDDISKSCNDIPTQSKLTSYPINTDKHSFQSSWYKERPWLEYSVKNNMVYCYYCRHFSCNRSNNHNAFTTTGFNNWKRALEATGGLLKYSQSKLHVTSTKNYESYVSQRQSNSNVMNKLDPGRVIHIPCQMIIFRDHRENSQSSNQGNFLEILYWSATSDLVVKSIVEGSAGNASYLIHDIQNELINIMANQVRGKFSSMVSTHCLIVKNKLL
ncbi:unnamed protein product [Adineta ricciae]|uniref:TTF-type domain-containing protein n=1 Tax=Adineta ricciae TaxID=249248 RepID=A0A815QN10_ADIRI|nr:unnamed protein product [Adineta ricciae]